MATIAVGDVHGNLAALEDLLGQLRQEVAADDVVVFLGDYIDRGLHSRHCIDAILAFRQEVIASVVCLRGNHEDWMLRTMRDYTQHSWLLGMDALDTIRSYSPEAARILREAASTKSKLYLGREKLPYYEFFDIVPETHHWFWRDLLPYYESPDCFCAHAGLDPRVPRIEDQSEETFMWGSVRFPDGYCGERAVVYGHWNNAEIGADGWPTPRIVGRTMGVDTIFHGVLTAIRLPDMRVFQSGRYEVPATECEL